MIYWAANVLYKAHLEGQLASVYVLNSFLVLRVCYQFRMLLFITLFVHLSLPEEMLVYSLSQY